jgi:hypothetical protein
LNPDGMLVFVGTRYHDGDHFGRAIRDQGLKSISGMPLPGVFEKKDGLWDCFFLAARYADGTPTFPTVWDDDRLKRYEVSNNAHYWAQMMNAPSESEYNPLTRAKIERLLCEPKDVPRTLRLSMHMDCAFKKPDQQRRGDESVLQVWGHARDGSGEVWYLDGIGSNRWTEEKFLAQLILMVQKWRLRGYRIAVMTDEQEMGGHEGTWENRLRTGFADANTVMPPFTVLKRGITKKEQRFIHAASFWADGYVHLPRGAPGLQSLINQMCSIGASAHDDWLDPAADVFHEEVYVPMRRFGKDAQPPRPERPGDEILKPVRAISLDDALRLYDRAHRTDNLAPYEPI